MNLIALSIFDIILDGFLDINTLVGSITIVSLFAFSALIEYVGESGSGFAVKAINNTLMATHLWALAEGLTVLKSNGVDLTAALNCINHSSGKSSISENIMAILETRKDLNKQQRQQRLNELLADFKISHIKDSLGMSVSGGERRRAEIARALAADPKFMLLDEPFAGVDPISVGDIKDIIQSLKDRGIGVLITDHNVRETLAICEKAYIVSEGSVIAEGTPQEILDNEKVRKVYLGDDFVV